MSTPFLGKTVKIFALFEKKYEAYYFFSFITENDHNNSKILD